jgi:hypothetical protein
VPELKIQERPLSTIRNIDDGPLRGAGAGDPEVPTINIRKHRWQAPWEVLELKIREHPPSTLRNIDGGPPGRCQSWRSESGHHQHYKTSTAGLLGGARAEDLGTPTINVRKH